LDAKNFQNILKSPDKPNDQLLSINNSGLNITQNSSNLLIPNNLGSATNTTIGSGTTTTALLNASNSSQNSNFYENTMHSDNSSIQNKRKSVISSHSTGSSNEVISKIILRITIYANYKWFSTGAYIVFSTTNPDKIYKFEKSNNSSKSKNINTHFNGRKLSS